MDRKELELTIRLARPAQWMNLLNTLDTYNKVEALKIMIPIAESLQLYKNDAGFREIVEDMRQTLKECKDIAAREKEEKRSHKMKMKKNFDMMEANIREIQKIMAQEVKNNPADEIHRNAAKEFINIIRGSKTFDAQLWRDAGIDPDA